MQRSIKLLHLTGMSLLLMQDLSHDRDASRQVNRSVRSSPACSLSWVVSRSRFDWMGVSLKVVREAACVVSIGLGVFVAACRVPFNATRVAATVSRSGAWFGEIAVECLRSARAA